MISAFFAKYKLIFYVALITTTILILGNLYRTYNNAVNDNKVLKEQLVVKDVKIDELNKDIKFKQDVIDSTKLRLDAVNQILETRKNNVKVVKEASKKFHEETISVISTPESNIEIDTYLVDRYNTILHCIEKVTKDEKDNC